MEMTGECRIPADRLRVWEALNDPEVLSASIPNCQTIEKLSETEMKAIVNAKVGPLKAKFDGKVTLSNLNPPESYTLSGEGQGAGGVGFAKGSVDVTLHEDGSDTVLSYAVSAQVGGKLAQIGSRLIDSVAQQQAKQFFTAFVGHFESPAAEAGPVNEAVGGKTITPPPQADMSAPAAEAPKASPLATPASKQKGELGYFVGPSILFVVMLVLLYLHQTGW